MPLLRADDDVARLRGVWLGPDASIRFPVDWTFQEHVVFAVTTVAVWLFVVPSIWFFWGATGAEKIEQLMLTAVPAIPIGPGCGILAKQRVAPIINSDRRLSWLVAGWALTAKALWWAHGPIDRGVVFGAAGAWVLTLPVAAHLPGPMLLWVLVAAPGCVQAARWVRDRVESPDRHRERTWARLDRSPGRVSCETVVSCDVPVRHDRCIPRLPYRPSTRIRFVFDLLPKGSKP